MLVLHPDSSCDICLESYNSTKTPHAIACGHIFCYECLQTWDSHICPLCRKKYGMDRAKKLHVEAAPAGADRQSSQAGFAEHLQMIAMVSGEGSAEEAVENVEAQVNEWIGALPSQHLHVRPLRLAMDSVLRSRKTRADLKEMQEQQAATERRINRLEEDLRTAQLVERSLLDQNEQTKQEFDTLKIKYDHLLREDATSTRSKSSAGSIFDNRSNKSDEIKTKKRFSVDGAYSITPGAPHSERVLPPPQRKSATDANTTLDNRRKDKGKRAEGQTSALTSALGLFIGPSAERNVTSLGVDTPIRGMTRGAVEVEPVVPSSSSRLWNGTTNALGMEVDIPAANGYHGPVRNDDRNRSHGYSRSNGDPIRLPLARQGSSNANDFAEFSLLSPPDSNGSADQQVHQGLDAVSNGHSIIEVATPQSATSWGTTVLSSQASRSSFSIDDLNLEGLPPVTSRSSLNLNITGLPDFEAGSIDSDDDDEAETGFVTPSVGRHSDLSQSRPVASMPRSTEASDYHNRHLNRSRHMSVPDGTRAGMTPRVLGRSVSDTTHSALTGPRLMDLDSDEELEVVAMRFSQSFSEVEPALSGSSTHAPDSFNGTAGTERSHRRRSSTSVALDLGSLDTDWVDIAQVDDISAPSQLESRSVTFSTPKPRLDTAQSQPAQNNGSRTHALYTSFVQKRPQTPKTVPAAPYVNTTRVVASSSAANGASNPMHRGVATIAAPVRPLPPTSYDPTYTSVRPSNGRPLPAVRHTNPYVPPAVLPQHGTDNHGIYAGTQPSHASYTLQPVSAPAESSSQPRSTSSTAQAPVLHAPQPVSGKSHIGRPWRDWAR